MTDKPDGTETPYGDWVGSLYSMFGHRYDWQLSIFRDGSYSRKEMNTRHPKQVVVESGTWALTDHKSVLALDPREGKKTSWWIHQVTGLESAPTILVLRQAMLASRNLPILLYRVYPAPQITAPLDAYGFPETWPE